MKGEWDMTSVKTRSTISASPMKKILVMQVISFGTMLLLAASCAFLIGNELLGESSRGISASVTLVASTFLGAISIRNDEILELIILRFIGSGVYYGILICTAALFFSTGFQRMGTNALLVFTGCGCAAITGFVRKRTGSRKRYKYRSR